MSTKKLATVIIEYEDCTRQIGDAWLVKVQRSRTALGRPETWTMKICGEGPIRVYDWGKEEASDD